MNTPVSFEIAKLLKEKRFDEDCNFYYSESFEIESFEYYHIDRKYSDYTGYPDDVLYFAPTIAEVVMWCFNKYKYSIEYSMNIPESEEYDGCYVFNGLIKGSEDYKLKIFYTSKDYPTVEKALEDTINHFLINFC